MCVCACQTNQGLLLEKGVNVVMEDGIEVDELKKLPILVKSTRTGILIRDGFKKKKLMKFSIKLAGWILNTPVLH